MLIIRDAQLAVLQAYKVRQFENLMVQHLKTYLPRQCRELGDKGTLREIRYGIEKTEAYGIVLERDVSRFICLMLLLGRDFDKDPISTWTSTILDSDCMSPSQKMDALYREAETRLQQ